MIKTRLYSLLAVGAAALLLSSCMGDDVGRSSGTSPSSPSGISVSVEDGLYSASGGTRAIPDGLQTIFEAGDAIGVFAVDGSGKVVRSNVKYVCNGVSWSVGDAATVPVRFADDLSYYAYCPYQDDLSSLSPSVAEGKTVDAAATADGFFAELTDKWEVKDNQKLRADYVASDLMVAKGTHTASAGDYGVSFEMFHQMGMVLLSFGEMTRMVDAGITWKEPITQTFKGEVQPFVWNGVCRYIVNPANSTAKTLTASDDTWTKDVRVSQRGHYREYKIEALVGYKLAVGDIAWSDGSFSKTMQYDRFYDKRPIGIVAHLGSDEVTGLDTDGDGNLLYTHGVIVATSGVGNFQMFNTNGQSIADKSSAFVKCNRYELAAKDFGGLKKTDFLHSLGDGFLAAKVRAYGRKAPSAYKNSGWYVGSAGQWCQIVADLGGNVNDFLGKWKSNTQALGFDRRGVDANTLSQLLVKMNKTADYYKWGANRIITTSSVGSGANFVTICWEDNNNMKVYLNAINNDTSGWTFPICSF